MQKHGILLIVCTFLILASRTKSSVGPSLEDILSANPKLQVVLDKFQDDPLKHRAAVFLIENLPFHYSYEGEALNDYLKLFELHGKGTMYPDKVLDSIKRRTTLADKLKLLTGLTPSAFISNVRLQAACRLIDEKKKIRIADLAYAVGFNDPKYFSSCFKKKFGLSPTEYMMKYDG